MKKHVFNMKFVSAKIDNTKIRQWSSFRCMEQTFCLNFKKCTTITSFQVINYKDRLGEYRKIFYCKIHQAAKKDSNSWTLKLTIKGGTTRL